MPARDKSKAGSGSRRPEVLPPEEERRFYDRLRRRIEAWTRGRAGSAATTVLLAGPDLFVLLARLTRDSRVPRPDKIKLAAVLAYFIAPVDLLPELFLGPFGYVDDVALTAFVLDRFVNRQDSALIDAHWPGDEHVLVVIQRVLKLAKTVLGGQLWDRLRRTLT
jgi:uncharacterized membrane protein YkvA (DUF1232 family)